MAQKVPQSDGERTEPGTTSMEAEQALLGALLTCPEEVSKSLGDLLEDDVPSWFAAERAHAALARAAIDLLKAGKPLDPILVQVELAQRGELGTVVPSELPLALGRAIGSTANARHYALVLRTLRDRRGVDQDGLDAISVRTALTALDDLEMETARIPTGWARLDERLGGGFAVPSLNVLGAAPKSGKSTWAQIVAERHVERGGFAYVLDAENGLKLFLRRMVARRAQVGVSQVVAAMKDKRAAVFRSTGEVDRWQEAKAAIWERIGPRLFVERRLPRVEALEARIAAARKRAGTAPLLVVIDSLQKLPMKLDERRAAIDWWLRHLERLRLDYNAVILAISELKRSEGGYEAREDAFKESGSIEYSADMLMALTRPAADGDDVEEDAPSTLRVMMARDADRDPRGLIASYKAVRPWYGLEELPPGVQTGGGAKGNGKRGGRAAGGERAGPKGGWGLMDGEEEER